jgi:hypothetical protein
VEGAGGQWSLLAQEDPGGRPRSAGVRTAWKSRRTGSAAEAPDKLIVAAVGQAILTTAGMLSGWNSSIVSVSAPVIGPEDRMVDWVTGTRFLDKWVSGPSGVAIFWRATPSTLIGFHDQLQGHVRAVKRWTSWIDSQRRARVWRGKV